MAYPLLAQDSPPVASIESRIAKHRYGSENILQYYEVFRPESVKKDGTPPSYKQNNDTVWIVYIHGGAWRDPLITSHSFIQFLKCLYPTEPGHMSSSPSTAASASYASATPTTSHIAGIASLSYRLSPHPSHSQDPTTTPAYELRDAKHPDHIEDIVAAISALQERHGFGHRYVVVGHSCGATLGFQLAMCADKPWSAPLMPSSPSIGSGGSEHGGPTATDQTASPAAAEKKAFQEITSTTSCLKPLAIVGVEGIYDIPLLVSDYADIPAYRIFTEAAFGSSSDVWKSASPATFGYEDFVRHWAEKVITTTGEKKKEKESRGSVLAMLAHSPDDELVNMRQVEAMEKSLRGPPTELQGESQGQGSTLIDYRFLELKGKHHDVWAKGEEMARCVTEAVAALFPPTPSTSPTSWV